MADSYDDMEEEARFESMLGGPSGPKMSNSHVQRARVEMPSPPVEVEGVRAVVREPGYYEATEVPPRQRFRFELNIGTGERDLLDCDNEDRYVPLKITDYAAAAMLQLLNAYPEIATQDWQTGRADVSDQVMDAVQAVYDAALKIKQYGFHTNDPREELVKLKKMLTDRGI
jgi:hypothetical protein